MNSSLVDSLDGTVCNIEWGPRRFEFEPKSRFPSVRIQFKHTYHICRFSIKIPRFFDDPHDKPLENDSGSSPNSC